MNKQFLNLILITILSLFLYLIVAFKANSKEQLYLLCKIVATKEGFDFVEIGKKPMGKNTCEKLAGKHSKLICIADIQQAHVEVER